MAESKGRHPMTPGEDHHVGFNKALQQALDKMGDDWEKGGAKHTCKVTLELDEVTVNSPGSIGFYQVTITQT